MRTLFSLLVAIALCSLAACSDSNASGACKRNSSCTAGSICVSGTCVQLCSTQADCPSGEFCDGTTCVASSGGDLPLIGSIVGNDASDPAKVIDGVKVVGANLSAAVFELRDASATAVALSVRSQTDGEAEVLLPTDVVSGEYSLVATNSAGSDQAPVSLLLPELSGTEIVSRINDSGTSGTLSISRLPMGNVNGTVAAGEHDHLGDAALRADVRSFIETNGLALSGDLSAASGTFAGGLKVGSTGAACDTATAGTLRYGGGVLEVCTTAGWVVIERARDGTSAATAAKDCKTLLAEFPSTADGIYWLDPEGQGNAFQTYCDMTTNQGGWTMVVNVAPNDGNSVGYSNEDFWTKEMSYGSLGNRFSNDYKSGAAWRVAGTELLIQSTESGAAGAILGWRRWPLIGGPRTFDSLFEPTGMAYAYGGPGRQACDTGAADAVNVGTTNASDAIIRQGTCLKADYSPASISAWPDMTRLTTTTGTTDNTMGGIATFIDGYPSYQPTDPFMGLDHAGCSGASCTHTNLCRAGTDCKGNYCPSTYATGSCGAVWNTRVFVR